MLDNTEIKLHIPENDVENPELSIVIPALNEELTITEFISWCHQGMKTADIKGEILIIDSSTDRTRELALAAGARVLETPKRGLGRAYIDAIPHIRGRYILMGDADCTYDFRELSPFVEMFHKGFEYIMGSRYKGSIESGAMPPLHQYFGTPLTTQILNVLYSSKFSDIHCGMRGITKDALIRLKLQSQSWEYASEMVLKSCHMKLKTTEVPVYFKKDVEGRLSHHKRSGWFSPWAAAWINLKAMFVYGADFFLFKPGILALLLGICLIIPLSFGPITVQNYTFSLNWMFFGVSLAVLGLHGIFMGSIARIFYDYTNHSTGKLLKRFSYTRTVLISFGIFILGTIFCSFLIASYYWFGFSLPESSIYANHLAITGMFLILAGLMMFTFTLMIHAAAFHVGRNSSLME